MGRHSPQAKRNKRKMQKLKKRHPLCPPSRGSITEFSQGNEGICGSISDVNPPHENESVCGNISDADSEGFFAALDRIADEQLKYWNEHKKAIEKFNDVHPAIVSNKEHSIEVYVNGARRGKRGLDRVSVEHYFCSIQRREKESQRLMKVFRDRVDELESELESSKEEIEKMKRENNKSIKRVRNFWRNRIFEEASRGGQMLMSALRQ